MLKAGTLDRRITFQTESISDDGQGGGASSWADTLTVWAGVEPARSAEQFAAQQLGQRVTHKITVRYSTDTAAVTHAMRVKYGTRTFRITGIRNPSEGREMLEIMTEEES